MRILIADDHHLVREALKQMISGLGDEVEVLECSSFPDAETSAEENDGIDLAVLDLRMPGASSAGDFCRRFPQIPTVILSGYYQRQDVVNAFQNGAAGFVPKTMNSKAMLNVLRLVLAGEKYIPDDFMPDGNEESHGSKEEGAAHKKGRLTAREGEVLAKLSGGLSNKAIAIELGIAEVTVKLHLRKVYQKLGANNRAHAVTLAHTQGLDVE